MLITVTIGQLLLLIIGGIVIFVFIYILQTVKDLRKTTSHGVNLIERNEEQISRIIIHVEQMSSDASEISRILCSGNTRSTEKPEPARRDLVHDLQDLKRSFRELSVSAANFRKMIGNL